MNWNRMKSKAGFEILACVLLLAFIPVRADAQLLPGERAVVIEAIRGVIGADADWELLWAGLDNGDGIVASSDGGVFFAQEQFDRIRKIGPDGAVSIFIGSESDEPTHVMNTYGAGSLSGDTQGRLLAAHRTCTDNFRPTVAAACTDRTRISILLPELRILADQFPNGESIGRPNDLIADSRGGAYFTSRPEPFTGRGPVSGVYYADREGVVSMQAGDLGPNGIMLSPDEATLYVTNGGTIVAYDVEDDSSLTNRRDFGTLEAGGNGDGMAVDSSGRLYVTSNPGVQVFSHQGEHLGLIPTHRPTNTLTFSGPGKRTLFVMTQGAVGPDGRNYEPPEGQRNMGRTLYTIPVLTGGFQGRAK